MNRIIRIAALPIDFFHCRILIPTPIVKVKPEAQISRKQRVRGRVSCPPSSLIGGSPILLVRIEALKIPTKFNSELSMRPPH